MAGTLLHRLFHHCHLVNTRGNRYGCGGGMTWSRRSGRFLRGSTRNKCRLPKQRHLGEAARASGREPSRRRLRSAPPRPCGPPCRPTPGELAGVGVPNRRSRPSARRCRRWFRAPARCRSETGAPSVVGAGFALPRDAGQRPALQALSALVSRSRAMPVGDRRSKPRRPCAGIPRRTQKKPARWRVSRGAATAAPRGVPVDCDRGQVTVR